MEASVICQALVDQIIELCTPEKLTELASRHYQQRPIKTDATSWRIPEDSRDRNPALTITEKDGRTVWYDHRRLDGGDAIKFVRVVEGLDFKHAVSYLAEYLGIDQTRDQNRGQNLPKQREESSKVEGTTIDEDSMIASIEARKAYDTFLAAYGGMLRDGLQSEGFKRLCNLRCFDVALCRNLPNIGYAEDGISGIKGLQKFTTIQAHSLVFWDGFTIKVIRFNPFDGKRYQGKGGLKQFGACHWNPANKEAEEIWLTEGETSAIALMCLGRNARPLKPERSANLEYEVSGYKRVYLAYDNDTQGRKYTQAALAYLPNALDISPIWGEGKDPNDFLIDGGIESIAVLDNAVKELQEAQKELPKSALDNPICAALSEYSESVNALKKYLKPKPRKDGSVELEYERGYISPFIDWMATRGLSQEAFCTDNGIRTKEGDYLDVNWITHEMQMMEQLANFPTQGITGKAMMLQAANYAASLNKRDALQEAIQNLPTWDGIDRISTFFAHYCGAEDTQINQAIARYMWTALIGRGVATYDKPCKADMCILLKGVQGVGKSSLAEALAFKKDWFKAVDPKKDEDELTRQLRAAQVVELSELNAVTERSLGTLKRIITSTKLECRKKGNDEFWRFPLRALFVATNDSVEGILNDPNGNRRWLPVYCHGVKEINRGNSKQMIIDTEGIERDKLQLYAQAKQLFAEHGVMWEGIDIESQQALTSNEVVSAQNAEDLLSTMRKKHIKEITIKEAILELFNGDEDKALTSMVNRRFQMELAKELRILGFTSKQKRGASGKTTYWTHPDLADMEEISYEQAVTEYSLVKVGAHNGMSRTEYLKRNPDRQQALDNLDSEMKGSNPFKEDSRFVTQSLEEILSDMNI